ncbi:MAG: sugar transferase [Lachnospiraceae bacterium]
MYERKRNGWKKHLDFLVIDILITQIALQLAYWFHYQRFVAYGDNNYLRIAVVLVLFNILVSYTRDSYRNILKRGYLVELKETIIHLVFVISLGMLTLVLMKVTEIYSRRVLVMLGIFSVLLVYIVRTLWKEVIRRRMAEKCKKRPVLLLTSADIADRVVLHLNSQIFKDFHIAGLVLVDDKYAVGQKISGIAVVSKAENLPNYLMGTVIDEVFVASSTRYMISDEILEACVEMGTTVHLSLGMIRETDNRCVGKFGGYTVLSRSLKMASSGQMLVKRAMDITGGIIGMLLTGMLCVFVVPAIKISDHGPVFFKQKRVGKNGRIFEIYKFRSMYRNAETEKEELLQHNKMQGLMFKMDNDPRVIKGIGQFIRNTSIDEFPQFWNVLKGDMSLVGTRPPTLDEYEKYEMHHIKRMSIKPGITGMWQSSGRNAIHDFEDVVRLDAAYIQNWSILLDIQILLKTIAIVLKREGAV